MTRIAFSLLALALLAAAGQAAAAEGGATCTRWDAAGDFLTPPDQANPGTDACGNPVWSYLRSSTLAADPAGYVRLGQFWHVDLATWSDPGGDFIVPENGIHLPAVSFNDSGVTYPAGPWQWPAGALMVHPGRTQRAVVAFRAPFTGLAQLDLVRFAYQDPTCGNGTDWAVGLGSVNFASGTTTVGVPGEVRGPISVRAGDVLYASVGPNGLGLFECDSTRVDVQLHMRSIQVAVDVKPGSDGNPVKLSARGVVPVAILSSAAFDAASVDPASLVLGAAKVAIRDGLPQALLQDVDLDGRLDLVAQFPVADTGLKVGDRTVSLAGALWSGTELFGQDVVTVQP